MPSTRERASGKGSRVTFELDVYEAVTIRKNPTTQLAIRIREWRGNVFLLWLPESVARLQQDHKSGKLVRDSLWDNYTPDVAHQDFEPTPGGGLLWGYDGHADLSVEAELTPHGRTLLLEVRMTNRSGKEMTEVSAQNCFHLSAAPEFSCGDFSRIYIRSEGEWRSLSSLSPTTDFPMFYRPGFLASGRPDRWGGLFSHSNQTSEADHPLIVCVARDGHRAVGTAAEDYQCVFHNAHYAYLRCIHSQQAPERLLGAGETVVFRQKIYFVEDGLRAAVAAFEADVVGDLSMIYRFRDRAD
jgi:hypothetical protein